MADYKSNFKSKDVYNPSYSVEKLSGLVNYHVVTSGEASAKKCEISRMKIQEGKELSPALIATIYRGTNCLTSNYSVDFKAENGYMVVYIAGNENYTMTAKDSIVYMVEYHEI